VSFVIWDHTVLPALRSPWNFAVKLTMRKLVMGLSSSEDPMIVAGVNLTHCQRVTDGQTDRRMDRRTDGRTELL